MQEACKDSVRTPGAVYTKRHPVAFLSIVSSWPRVNVSLGHFDLLYEENGIAYICWPGAGMYTWTDSHGSLLSQVTNKQRREQQRLEKKKRQEERHRHKALESRSHRGSNRSEADASTQVTLVKTFAALSI